MAKTKYEQLVEPKLLQVEAWARNGLTDEQIANNLGIAYSTFRTYRDKHLAFSAALKKGKEVVDIEVENALLKKALGYSVEEVSQEMDAEGNVYSKKVTTKHYPPDTASMIFWLTNRLADLWKNRRDNSYDIKDRKAAAAEIKELAQRLNDPE